MDDQTSSAIFISNNIEEFTDNKNLENFHPDIMPLVCDPPLKFQRHLAKALILGEQIGEQINEFYRLQEAYSEENVIVCSSPTCTSVEGLEWHVYLDIIIEIVREYAAQDPAQLDLFTGNPQIIKKPVHAKMGSCLFCHTSYFECTVCDTIITDVDHDEPFTCGNCGTIYQYSGHNSTTGLDILAIKDRLVQ